MENEEKKLQNTALARLQELDSQIARNRAEDTDMTANSQRAAAESEWRLWETELQRMMEILKEKLDRTQQDTLMRQQREWIRSREEQAVEISRKQMGSAMEEREKNYITCKVGIGINLAVFLGLTAIFIRGFVR